jgi:hypothetical protein
MPPPSSAVHAACIEPRPRFRRPPRFPHPGPMSSSTQSPEVQNKKLTGETMRDGPTATCVGGVSTEPAAPAATTSARHGAAVSPVAPARRTLGGPGDIEVNATGSDCGAGTVGDEVRGGGSGTDGGCPGGTSTESAAPAATTSARHGAATSPVASARITSGGPGDIEVNATDGDCGAGTIGDEVRGGGSGTGGGCPSSMT